MNEKVHFGTTYTSLHLLSKETGCTLMWLLQKYNGLDRKEHPPLMFSQVG